MFGCHSAIEVFLGDFQRLSWFRSYYFQQSVEQRGVPDGFGDLNLKEIGVFSCDNLV
jgi:hypothetical protein